MYIYAWNINGENILALPKYSNIQSRVPPTAINPTPAPKILKLNLIQ